MGFLDREQGSSQLAGEDQTTALLAALRHPLRREVLRLFMTTDAALSPREIARGFNRPLSNVSYHVRKLDEVGAIQLTSTAQVRGSLQHFYRPNDDLRSIGWVMEALGLLPDG